jgi:hypothetical protein
MDQKMTKIRNEQRPETDKEQKLEMDRGQKLTKSKNLPRPEDKKARNRQRLETGRGHKKTCKGQKLLQARNGQRPETDPGQKLKKARN